MITAIGIIFGLILLNGLFVAAEFAIVGAPRASIDRLARSGHRAARAVQVVLDNPTRQDRFIATAQLGITLASLGLGMYGEHQLAGWLAGVLERLGPSRWIAAHTLASILAVGVLTYLHIVLGEMVPKSVALQRAERTVLRIAPIMRAIELTLFPLVVALNGVGNGVLRLVGIRRSRVSQEHYRTSQELSYLVRETVAGGLLRKESGRVVQELFAFGELTAGDVMVARVKVRGLPLGAQRDDIREALGEHAHTRYPVYEGSIDRIVGMVHVKDLLRCLTAGGTLTAEYVKPIPFVPATVMMKPLMAAMAQVGSQLAVVLDEHGGTIGILTVEDLFEEIVGEFGENPDSLPSLTWEGPGRLLVAGAVRLEVVGEAFGVALEHHEVDTTGGLVLDLLGRPPRAGDRITYEDFVFEVVSVEGRGVRQARVSRPPAT
jgi:CBS domain containing-hemolysin-like protein